MLRGITLVAGLLVLSACLDAGSPGDVLARDAAKGVVNNVLATRFPGADISPISDCVIDNASGTEIVQIAQAAVVGTSAQTTQLVLGIAQRPATVNCIAERTLTAGNLLGVLGNL